MDDKQRKTLIMIGIVLFVLMVLTAILLLTRKRDDVVDEGGSFIGGSV